MTLFTTPVIYIYLDKLRGRRGREEPQGPAESELAPAE
jgi:hypothetical protein